MTSPKLYVSGAITGMPDLNRVLFSNATEKLREMGFDVVNPHEICAGISADEWSKCMQICIIALVACSVMILLPGWQESRGATLEYTIATALGIRTITLEEFLTKYSF